MDDKRTLLAFLVIGLILLLLPYYYEWMGLTSEEPLPPEEKEVTQTPQTQGESQQPSSFQETIASPSSNPSQASSSASIAQTESFVPQEIVVRTPLLRLVLSTNGGGIITSCQLLHYQRVDGQPVELIPPGGRGLTLSLQHLDQVTDLSRTGFSADRNELEVAENAEVLRFSTRLDEGKQLVKIFTFYPDRYGFDLELAYQGFDEDTEALLTWHKGIAFTEKDPRIDLPEVRVFALFNDDLTKIQLKDDAQEEIWGPYKGSLQWAGVRNKYFLSAIAPQDEGRTRIFLRGQGVGSNLLPDYSYEVGTRLGTDGSWQNVIYLGPLDYDHLIRYGVQLEQAIDFGWPVVGQISKLLLVVFKATHNVIPNYGWIIVLFSVVIKIIVYPLTNKTYESTNKMQELQPKITALREKYKNDQQRLSKETMKLYKEEGVNPLGGCLPMLLQMPIFFALYNLFGRTIELRQAPFTLWIKDLSTPDELVIAGFSLHILPFLMGISMLVQQKMTMKDPKQAFLVYFMPVMMIFIFWSMSSGLVLYWTVFNILSILQQLLINRFKKESISV